MTDIQSTTGGGSAISWRTVEVFRNRSMADVASSALRSAGLTVRVMADDAEGVGLPLGLRFNGAEVQVPTGDVDEARALLDGQFGLDLDDNDLDVDGDLDDVELDDMEEDGPIDASGLDMGVGTAFKVVATVILVGLLAAALWGAIG